MMAFSEWVDTYGATIDDAPSLDHMYAEGIRMVLGQQVVVDALGKDDRDYPEWVQMQQNVFARLRILTKRMRELGRAGWQASGHGLSTEQVQNFEKLRLEYIGVVDVKPRTRAGSYDTFERRYSPVTNPDEETILRVWDDPALEDVDIRYIWTVVEAEGKLYLTPGYAVVNYMGRVLCENPWSDTEERNPGYVY